MSRQFRTEWLQARRRQVGHTTWSVSTHLGVSPATIRAIEGGASPAIYPFGLLDRYAAALGCRIDDLFDEGGCDVELTEVAQVVATIVAAGGHVLIDVAADALGWTPEHIRDVLREAAGKLDTVGLALTWRADSAVTIVPSAVAVTPTTPLAWASVAATGLNEPQARVIATLARTGRLNRTASTMASSMLIDAGLVEHSTSHRTSPHIHHGVRAAVQLSDTTRYDLVLEP